MKTVLCFTPAQGQYALGATAHQHAQLGPIVVMQTGERLGKAAAGDRVLRMPAAQAIEFALALEAAGRRALAGQTDPAEPVS